jgi:hypothetical protein
MMRHAAIVAGMLVCLGSAGAHVERSAREGQRGAIIDRVLAVVDGHIVTLSDVQAALNFGLVPPDVSDDPVQAVLERLIDRRLILAEVERYAPPEPSPAAVEAGVAEIERRFPDPSAFETVLAQSAMSRDELRRHLRDSLRIEAYMAQRFSSVAQPSDDEIARYYKEHPAEFTFDGVQRPLHEVREQVAERLVEDRKAQAAREWLAGLRRRGSIVIVPAVSRS